MIGPWLFGQLSSSATCCVLANVKVCRKVCIAVIALAFAALPAFAAPRSASRSVSLAAVQKLKAPLTLAAVEKAFGPATEEPGPRVTYRSAEHKGMSLWFWYWRPQHVDAISKDAIHIECVILATTTAEEKRRVVWPPDSVHLSPETLIRKVNERYNRK